MSWTLRVRRWPLWPMLRKEFIQMRRDRFTLGMMIGTPAIQLALFGYAIQTEVRHLPTLVLDESHSSESRALLKTFENTTNFDLIGEVPTRVALTDAIALGRARAGIVIPPEFSRDLARQQHVEVQVLIDASDPMASTGAINAAAVAGASYSRTLAPPVAGNTAGVDVRIRPLYNPGLRTAVNIVPGIIGILLSMTMVIIASLAVVRERERGTLEQLIVTPIGKTSLMLGKILPFVVVGYVQITVILVLGRVLFRVPMIGSLAQLYVVAFPFILANLGLGIFLSTLVTNQAQAMQLGFLTLLPNILLSGFMFPREAMPAPAQWVGAALPLTYFLKVLRGILLKGAGLGGLWREGLALVGFSVGLVALSVWKFRKQLE
ncbi:MAG: ABC transporter permease [Gemmatimonadota bacterium]